MGKVAYSAGCIDSVFWERSMLGNVGRQDVARLSQHFLKKKMFGILETMAVHLTK